MYNFYQPGRDYFPAPNQPTYSTGPKLLDPSPVQPPTYQPRKPPWERNVPRYPGESGYRRLATTPSAKPIPEIPQGYEQYLAPPINDAGYFNSNNFRGKGRGYRRIFFNGQYYMLPPGVAPPPGYQEPPQYTNVPY